jgi:hypothetical protein
MPPAARCFTGLFLKKSPREACGPVKHPQKLLIRGGHRLQPERILMQTMTAFVFLLKSLLIIDFRLVSLNRSNLDDSCPGKAKIYEKFSPKFQVFISKIKPFCSRQYSIIPLSIFLVPIVSRETLDFLICIFNRKCFT